MPKTAQEAVSKWQERSAVASNEYVEGARDPKRSQSQSAIAAKDVMVSEFQAAMARGAYEEGLREAGDQGWLAGIQEKGVANYQTGVASNSAGQKYVTESGKYDSARGAADGMPRGPRGSEQNFNRSKKVGQALRAVKTGSQR